jgi:hypothetical protein
MLPPTAFTRSRSPVRAEPRLASAPPAHAQQIDRKQSPDLLDDRREHLLRRRYLARSQARR